MRMILCFLMAATGVVWMAAAEAEPATIVGAWSGAGTVRYEGGSDRVLCRVSYAESTGRTYFLTATCATAGQSFQQDGRVVNIGGNRYVGRLYNSQYSVAGNLSVNVNGGSQSVTVTSPQGSASMVLNRR